MAIIKNFDEVKDKVKAFLPQYLEEKGYGQGQINCINPAHDDRHPSMGLVPQSNNTILSCFSCMPGDQEVVTLERGSIEIQNLVVGEHTIGLNGMPSKILAKIPQSGLAKPLYGIKLNCISKLLDLRFTLDHVQLVLPKENIPWIRLENARRYKFKSPEVFYQKFWDRPPRKYGNFSLSLKEVQTSNLRSGDYLFWPKREIIQDIIVPNTWTKNETVTYLKRQPAEKLVLTEGLMWLFGMYLAEGNTYRGGINFTLSGQELLLAEKLKIVIENELGYKVTIDQKSKAKNNTIKVRCSSTDLQRCFDLLFGKYCFGKRMPEYFLHLPHYLQLSILFGLFDGDGFCKNTKNILSLTSKELVRQAAQICVNNNILFTLGHWPEYTGRSDGRRRRPTWSLRIKASKGISSFYGVANSGQEGLFLRVEEVYTVKEREDVVWDITTSESTFLTNYYQVHNCKASFDIFDTYAILEDTPKEGTGWLLGTFLPLCKRYNVPVEMEELTEEDKYKYSVYRAYERAAQIIKDAEPTMALMKEVERRKWNMFVARDRFGIGSIKFTEFIEKLLAYGYTEAFLKEVDLYNKAIFHDKGVIIPIRDDKGTIVGFVTRNIGQTAQAKFTNTSNKCPIYKKGGVLFNFYQAKKAIPPLIITESYMDAITLTLQGMDNVVGIGATALTDSHLELLRKYNINDIVLALDFDKAGQDATAKYVEQLSGRTGLVLKILGLPNNFDDETIADPEDYVNKYGIEAFKQLPLLGAFEWKLKASNYKDEPYELAIKTVPIIANEPSFLEREKMCSILSQHTGISVMTIKEELDRIVNIESACRIEAKKNVIQKLMKDIQKYPLDAYSILTRTVTQLEEIETQSSDFIMSHDEYVDFLDYKKISEETTEDLAYHCGFPRFDLKTGSRWIEPGNMIAVGGRPNSGKTAWLVNLAYNIATMNDDIIVIFHTIDDSRYLLLPKFTSMLTGIRINHITAPEFYKQYWHNKDIFAERARAYSRLKELAIGDRLIIKDAEYGTTLESIERIIKRYQLQHPNKKVVYFLDNFHLLTDMATVTDERIRVKTQSRLLKNMMVRLGTSIFMTVEYTKLQPGERPHNSNILETGQIEFDCTGIFHVFNPYSDLGHNLDTKFDRDEWTWMEYDDITGETLVKPKIELITGKSKLSAFKGSYNFKFAPEISTFWELNTGDASI